MTLSRSHLRSLPTVLVTDDDAAMLACVVELVRRAGFAVETASRGRDALQILLHASIDLTISDVHLPDMTGFEVLETYTSGPWIAPPERGAAQRLQRATVPAIFMSGDATPEMHDRCASLGWPLFDKPFAVDEMRTAIEQVLGRAG